MATGLFCFMRHLDGGPSLLWGRALAAAETKQMVFSARGISADGHVKLGGCRLGGVRIDRDVGMTSTCTNQRNRGRTSADRSTKATLMLTVPRSLIKSSTKDLTWPSLEIVFRHTYTFKVQRCQGVVLIQDYCYSGNSGQGGYHPCQHGFWLRGVQS